MKVGGARDWYEAASNLGVNESTMTLTNRGPENEGGRSEALFGIKPAKDKESNKWQTSELWLRLLST